MRSRLRQVVAALPGVVFVTGVLAIAASWQFTGLRTSRLVQSSFDEEVDRVASTLDKRMTAQVQILRTFAALVGSGLAGDPGAWQIFARLIGSSDGLDGVIAIGHVQFKREGPTLGNLVVLMASDEATTLGMQRAAKRDLRNLWPDRASLRARLVMLDDEGAAVESETARPAKAMLVVPVPGDGLGPGGEAVRGFVFTYFVPAALVEATLRNVARKAHYSVAPQSWDAGRAPLFEDRTGAASGKRETVQTSRNAQIGDTMWTVRARASQDEFRVNSRIGPTFILMAGLTVFWTLCSWLLARCVLRDLGHTGQPNEVRLDQALEEASEVVEVAPDAIVVLNGEGRLIRVNRAAEYLLGATAQSLLGRGITEFLGDLPPDRARAALSSAEINVAGGLRRVRLTSALSHLEHSIPVEVHVSARAPEFGMFVCILRDTLKERRQAEEMHLYKLAMESSANAIVISDVRLPNQPILYVNPAFERMTGYDLTEVFGHHRSFLKGPDTDPVVIAKIESAVERGTDCQATIKNYRKDGLPIWLNVTLAPVRNQSGQVTHFISVETDVTETKQIEAALSERRQQLDAIFTLSADGFAAFALDHHVTYVNPAFLRITGLEMEEVLGCSLRDLDEMFRAASDPGQAYVPIAEQVRAADERGLGSAPRAELMFMRNPAPRVLQCGLRKAPGGATDFVLYLRDITRESEVDRMKSEFLSSAAHELRTPMASVYGFAELLLKRKYPEERQREMLETIHRQAKHLSNLVNELLDLARIEARAGRDFQMAEQSIVPLIKEVLESLLIPGDNRRVEVSLPEHVPLVRADSDKVRQALTNILSNAYKYSPNGGRIRLWTEERRASDRDFLGICVADEGIGMTPEQLARACERFYRADASGSIPGTGLGLSLVKEIMQLQGGSLELASEHAVGTTARLWLPVSATGARLRSAAA